MVPEVQPGYIHPRVAVPLLDADLHRGVGEGAPACHARHAPGTGTLTPRPGSPGAPPRAGLGHNKRMHTPWRGATSWGECPCPGKLHLLRDYVVHRDSESPGHGISPQAREGERGDAQGEGDELKHLARSM